MISSSKVLLMWLTTFEEAYRLPGFVKRVYKDYVNVVKFGSLIIFPKVELKKLS